MTIHCFCRRAFVPFVGLLGGLLGLGLVFAPALTAIEQNEKTIFLSVTDQDGKSVTDLTTQDIAILENPGAEREVINVKKSTQPLAIVMLADTTKQAGSTGMMSSQTSQAGAAELIRDIRVSTAAFMKDIVAGSPGSQMMLMEFGQAAVPITKMTSDLAELEKGVTRLFPKPDAASVLLEAIIEASKELAKTKTPRRAIVALNIEPGDEQSRQNIRQLHDGLVKARSTIWAVSLQVGTNKNQARGLVLEKLTGDHGGRREFIQSQSALEQVMKSFADNLLNQYEVTYRRPAGGPEPQIVRVGVRGRAGLKLHASLIPPQ
jgi:hypothetical protein